MQMRERVKQKMCMRESLPYVCLLPIKTLEETSITVELCI